MSIKIYRLKRMEGIEGSCCQAIWAADFYSMDELQEYISSRPGIYYVETIIVVE